MNRRRAGELFTKPDENPILTVENWPRPYKLNSVFNSAAIRINNEIMLLVRVKDRKGRSHLTLARSNDGKTNWRIGPEPTLKADRTSGEGIRGLEDPRIVWLDELQKYVIACVSFCGNIPGVSLITTPDFSTFERLDRPAIPGNKDASLFPKKINRHFVLIHRPSIEGAAADIWLSFSPDLEFWGKHRRLFSARPGLWDEKRIGLGPPPIWTPEGWLIIYHGAQDTGSGTVYRVGLALLHLERLEVIRRSEEWVLGPKEYYERVGDVDDVVFPCGFVVGETGELKLYYGAADTVVCLATADLNEILRYLKKCPRS